MKKLALVLCSIFLCSSLSFGYIGWYGDSETEYKEKKENKEKMMKEKDAYFKGLSDLVDKYNKASEKKKADVKKEIRDYVTKETNKDLAEKRTMISKMNDKVYDLEKNKESNIDKQVEMIITPEGQEKIKARSSKEWQDKQKTKKMM